jgi:ABC-2 type transport system permease protein
MKIRFLNQKNRAILREMVATDFKVRYQGSVLGYLWSVLRPLFIFLILYIVFVKFLRIGGDIPHFPVYLLLGIILWSFFSEATSQAMTSIVSRGDLIKKISIPRYLVVVSSLFSAVINLGLNLIVLLIIAVINDVEPMASWLLLPIILVELFIFAMALGFFFSALFVKYRDVGYVWEVILQAGFYIVPIIYPLTIVAEKYQPLIMLNPMAQIIQDARWAFVTKETLSSWKVLDLPYLFIPFIIIMVFMAIAIRYFKSQAGNFAENI